MADQNDDCTVEESYKSLSVFLKFQMANKRSDYREHTKTVLFFW